MSAIPRPDLSKRPFAMTCEQAVDAPPSDVFAAWTDRFDIWFAQSGTLSLKPEPGAPFFFYNRDDWGRHPHYGRILEIAQDKLVEMTWVTGNGDAVGTEGAETILRVELMPSGNGTLVRLSHSGFISEASRDAHAENWPLALDILNTALSSPS
ncbi:MAG: SRPBCC domain-containing protein [Pseudomonadota bacterium]